jgi:hypothetical protein
MPPEIVRRQWNYGDQPVENERGALLAVLVMVVLGVAAIFAVSA